MGEVKECIYREEAIRICERLRDKTANEIMAFALNWAIQDITGIPAEDVRPVVLCKDCKHNKAPKVWRFLDLEDVTADCSAGHGYPPMDWFCADGEKRSGDGAT